jgi:hypothetical protein
MMTATFGDHDRMPISPQEERTASRLRVLVLALFVAGTLGVGADLALIGHYEGAFQIAPLLLLGAGAATGLAVVLVPSRSLLLAFRAVLTAVVAGGGVGLWLHYQANLEFEREVSPALAGATLIWKAIQGASPPSAAPATLIHLAVLGWAGTIRHPALRRPM